MKKLTSVLLVLLMVASVFAQGANEATAAAPAGKQTINVMSFTDEVPNMVAKYMEMHPETAAKYDVNVTIVATTDQLYQPALDEALAAGGKDAPDIYAAEAAFVLKYTQGDAAQYASTYKALGIDVDKEIAKSQIAGYTVDIGSRKGEVVALGYQSTGGVFIYNRTVAKETWGTDDPAVVAEKIGAGTGSWDKFFEAAAELKAKGFGIVSGDGDVWHAVENSSDKGWVVDGQLVIDPKREAFLDISKKLKDNNYHNDTQDWQEGWFADMKEVGAKKVLGFYGPAWLINYTLAPNGAVSGDWAVCPSNIGFFWGGTWVLASKHVSDAKKAVVADIIKWITLDDSETGLQYMWANGLMNENGTKDSVASGSVLAKSNGEVAFLGGQNMFDAFIPANQYANGANLTQYDEAINAYWRDQVRQYTAGAKTREQAIADFKTSVAENLDVIVK